MPVIPHKPCSVLTTDYRQFAHLFEKYSSIAGLHLQLLSDAFIRNERREAMLLSCNAEQRYQWLHDNEAWILDRLPQFHIASYIGVDAVSLSRLKRRLATVENSG